MRKSDVAIGIDFGASFSTAAVFVDGRFCFAVDHRGDPCFPTAIHFPRRGPPSVGFLAAEMRQRDPTNTVVQFKRLLGATYDSDQRRFFDAVTNVRLKRGSGGSVSIRCTHGSYSPEEVASLIIRDLKRKVEERIGVSIRRATLTAPSRASSAARDATLKAARIAGFEEVTLVSEPCAAAVSFGLDLEQSCRRFLVYDFGGGTFDASVVEQQGAAFEVHAAGGDECLGGDNLDAELANHVANEVWRSKSVQITQDRLLWDNTVRSCELAKRALSAGPTTTIRVGGQHAPARLEGFRLPLERPAAESVWNELVQRSLTVSAQTLVASGSRPKDLSGVMLVGGSSYVPMVRRRVQEVFQATCASPAHAQTAVAMGAALLAAGQFGLSAAGWAA